MIGIEHLTSAPQMQRSRFIVCCVHIWTAAHILVTAATLFKQTNKGNLWLPQHEVDQCSFLHGLSGQWSLGVNDPCAGQQDVMPFTKVPWLCNQAEQAHAGLMIALG